MGTKWGVNLLLRANFYRLWRSAAFRVSVLVMAAAAVFELAVSYPHRAQPGILDNRYMIFVLMSGVVLSAFCSLFVGAEYSDGAIRNKIAAGHSRAAVYLANLLMTASLCAVFTLISLLYPNRAAAAILCISLAYFLLFLGIYLNSRLTEQAVIPAREYIENGQILVQEAMPNPSYVRGIKRTIFEVLYNLPGCQAVQLIATSASCPLRLPLVSLGAIAVSTAAGLFMFRRKDLK